MLNIGDGTSKYVKVWEVENQNGFVKGKVSTGSKKKDGSYENSNWLATFFGEAKEKALNLQKGDTIEILKGGIKSLYNKENKKTYTNLIIFDFCIQDEMTY